MKPGSRKDFPPLEGCEVGISAWENGRWQMIEVVTLKKGTDRGYRWGKRLDVPEGKVWSLPMSS